MTDDLVAAFLARGGVIAKVASGERTMTEREIYQNRANATKLSRSRIDDEQRLIDQRHVVIGSNGREHVRNGLGEWIA